MAGARHEAERERRLFGIFSGSRVVWLVQRFLRPRSVGEIRRGRLIAGGRLGQGIPGRLSLERGCLGFVTAEEPAEAAAIAELRRAQYRIIGGITGLHRIVVGARSGTGLDGVEVAGRQDTAGFPRILVCFFSRRYRSLATLLFRIFRPVRILDLAL